MAKNIHHFTRNKILRYFQNIQGLRREKNECYFLQLDNCWLDEEWVFLNNGPKCAENTPGWNHAHNRHHFSDILFQFNSAMPILKNASKFHSHNIHYITVSKKAEYRLLVTRWKNFFLLTGSGERWEYTRLTPRRQPSSFPRYLHLTSKQNSFL